MGSVGVPVTSIPNVLNCGGGKDGLATASFAVHPQVAVRTCFLVYVLS